MKGKTLNSQSQGFVLSLLNYFQQEKDNGGPLLPLSAIQERVVQALNISLSTVTRIQKRLSSNDNVLKSPGKKRPRKKTKTTDLTDAVKCNIRDTVYQMYSEKKHVTIPSLNKKLKEQELASISNSSLQRVLPSIGFKYKKDNNRRFLVEQTSIALLRTKFLRSYNEYVNTSSRKIIFMDETWIFSKGNPKKSWQDKSIKSVSRPLGFQGKRFIVVHAGSEQGFVDGASLVFSSQSKSSDYHGDMNSEIFIRWLKEKLLCNLEDPSVIIMDNAPYHSILSEKNPTTSSSKKEISDWLIKNKIEFQPTLTKVELLNIVKRNCKEKKYVVDEIIRSYGHEVLRTPPYQCEFNAIELIWANAKQYYDKHIGRNSHSDEHVIAMWNEALLKITPEVWKNCVKHTNKTILEWYNKTIFNEIEPLIILLDSESDDESEMSD